MIFTVITPAFNCAGFLERNLNSIRSQGFGPEDLEQWVIDGGSKDGTIEILKRHPEVKWVSEPDRGLSHAVNKGLERAKGEWICWLNADDEFVPGALLRFLEMLPRYSGEKLFVGDLERADYDGALKGIVPGRRYTFEGLTGVRSDINQPGMVVHRDVYSEIGGMRIDFRFAMDYEWAVRATKIYQFVHIPVVIARYHKRNGSITDINKVAVFREMALVRRMYNLPVLSKPDFKIRFYMWTEFLRRNRTIRCLIQSLKRKLRGTESPDGGIC